MRGKPLTRKSSSVYFHTRTSQTIADVRVYAGIQEGATLQRAQWGVILLLVAARLLRGIRGQ